MRRCNLCIWEKYFTIWKPDIATINRRNEVVSTSRHANKFLRVIYIMKHRKSYISSAILDEIPK
jgi:hypothetical protein